METLPIGAEIIGAGVSIIQHAQRLIDAGAAGVAKIRSAQAVIITVLLNMDA